MKKTKTAKLKYLTEKEHFDLQQKTIEELFKEHRKMAKSIGAVKNKKKNDPDLEKLKQELKKFQEKNKQEELKAMEVLKKKMKEVRALLLEGAEDIISEQKEINRDFNNQKAPYVEKMNIIERMIIEKEFKI
jgi:hypothetical protein